MRHLKDDELARVMEPRLSRLHALTVPATAPVPSAAQPQSREERSAPSGRPFVSPAAAGFASGPLTEPLRQSAPSASSPRPQSQSKAPDLSHELREFLADIADHPYRTTVQRRDALGLSTYKNDQIKKAILAGGYAEEIAINFGHTTRGNVKFLELTAKGYAALGKEAPPVRPLNMSPEHWWYQRAIADWYRKQGYRAEIEMSRNGTRADIGVSKDGKLIAVEVAITPKNEAVNAKKDLEAGFDSVLIACKNAKVKTVVEEKLRDALTASERGRVKVMLLSEGAFLKSVLSTALQKS